MSDLKTERGLVYPLSDPGGILFFGFEEDFVQDEVRCIPMIVRFKLDACGIKLKLSEWSRMRAEERKQLSEFVCASKEDLDQYRSCLNRLIVSRTGHEASSIPVDSSPAWSHRNEVPQLLMEKLQEFSWSVSLAQWQSLSNLQRFVLMKLCQPGHENKNFPKAMKEFGLV